MAGNLVDRSNCGTQLARKSYDVLAFIQENEMTEMRGRNTMSKLPNVKVLGREKYMYALGANDLKVNTCLKGPTVEMNICL